MASAPEEANNSITNRDGKFDIYKNNRSALINKIASYIGNTNKALLIKGVNGIEWWIIFVTDRTLIPNGAPYYDISITGTGIHFVYKAGSDVCNYSAEQWAYECATSPGNLLNQNVGKIEFYGKMATNKMNINSVVQKSTVGQTDDIADIDEISKSDFDNLCEKMATYVNFMNI